MKNNDVTFKQELNNEPVHITTPDEAIAVLERWDMKIQRGTFLRGSGVSAAITFLRNHHASLGRA